ncbi:hypothetical protein Pint_29054 [Pistacia integerrima]|uniref:Uncharacterized protein n=1 Tax=Pistacia integerrima TaxID=434235 RepID=A0ACC0X0R8_9ROSI|nr:hypothetical protein Pint_29054 [Pistacia integerrima]
MLLEEMLTCIACSKQQHQQLKSKNGSLPPEEEDDEVVGTPRTKQAIKTLSAQVFGLSYVEIFSFQKHFSLVFLTTRQIKDMALKASGAYKNCKPCSGSSNRNQNGNYADSDAASDSARFHCSYRRTGSSNSTPRMWGKEMEARLKGLIKWGRDSCIS